MNANIFQNTNNEQTYKGWTVYDEIQIVGRPLHRINKWNVDSTVIQQGYVLNPKDKKQLKTAETWCGLNDISDVSFRTTNEGFQIKLLSAIDEHSTKSVNWSCLVTKENRSYIVNVDSALLLETLTKVDVIKGVLQDSFMFGRYCGKLTLIGEHTSHCNDAKEDSATTTLMHKSRTSKHVIGNTYVTTTLSNVYLGKFYRWYEPIYSTEWDGLSWKTVLHGFRKLKTPVELYWFPTTDAEFTLLSEYVHSYTFNPSTTKPPVRRTGMTRIEVDMSENEMISYWNTKLVQMPVAQEKYIGLSTSGYHYTLPQEVEMYLTNNGYTLE